MVLAGVLLAAPAAQAGEKGLTGNWNVTVYERGTPLTLWLLKLEQKDGNLKGSVVTVEGFPKSVVSAVQQKGNALTLTIKMGGRPFGLEFNVPKGAGKTLLGSMTLGNQLLPAKMEVTKADTVQAKPPKELERFAYDQAKELVGKAGQDPRAFEAAAVLFRQAKANKASASDVKEWADALVKAAAKYGPRWQRETTKRVTGQLASVAADYPMVAEEAARNFLKAIGPKAGAEAEIQALSTLETVLRKTGKKDELKQVEARVTKLEEEGHKEALKDLPFTAQAAPEAKGDRAVLVELFTGAMCPPCVAADLACDGLEKTFKPSQVVVLEYHLHIPGPDALTTPASEERASYYGGRFGTPTIFFNGKSEAGGGGSREGAGEKYKEYLDVLKPLLEEKAKATVKAEAVRKGDKIEITARVSGLEKPGEKVKLRLVLVQPWVRYPGGNGLAYHSRVVRAMPGGADGFALKGKSGKHSATVDLGEVRQELKKYLEGMEKRRGPFPTATLPLNLRDLHVIAFVQDDESKQVMQAVEVAVKE